MQILCCLSPNSGFHYSRLTQQPMGACRFSTAVFDIALCARYFLNASIASDAFDSTYQTHETTDGLQSTKNCKVVSKTNCNRPNTTRSPRVHHVFPAYSSRVSTCLPRVHHVSTTCLPRVDHVFTTCSPRVYHVFTTCSRHVFTHVFTTCSPRVHHVSHLVWLNQVTERDEGVVDRDHFYVERHEARAFQCDRTT